MKVLMVSDVYPPLIGGQEREIQLLSEGICKKGHQASVCTLSHGASPSTKKENGVKVFRIESIYSQIPYLHLDPNRRFHPPIADPLVTMTLKKIIETETPDIIHAHGWMLYSVLPLEKKYRIPLCVTFHDYGFVCPCRCSPLHPGGVCDEPLASLQQCLSCGKNAYGSVKCLLPYYFLRLNRKFACDIMIFTDPNILTKMNCLELKKMYLEHPIDSDEHRPIRTEVYKNRILIWAKLERIKGIDTIFEVAQLLPQYQFDAIDAGVDKEYYKARKPHNVALLPKLRPKETPGLINRYPLIIGQFSAGTLGHSELEAMSCGKPVVAYWDRQYDRFYDEECPILGSKNIKEIVDVMESNIGNYALGRTNRLWILKYHDSLKVAEKLLKVYETLLHR